MRRGGREDRSHELLIPVSASMAHQLREKEQREAAEKAELKRLVLEAERRDLQEMRQQMLPQQQQQRRGGGPGRGAAGYYARGGGRGGHGHGGRHH